MDILGDYEPEEERYDDDYYRNDDYMGEYSQDEEIFE